MSKNLVKSHIKSASVLTVVMESVRDYIVANGAGITEYEVMQFIKKEFKRMNLETDKNPPIVAFGKSTSDIHHFPKKDGSPKLKKNDLIMIDIWAKAKKSCYADMTWMFFYGKTVPKQFTIAFDAISKARNECIKAIQKNLKKNIFVNGNIADAVVRDSLNKSGLGAYFLHGTGHSMDLTMVHGKYTGLSYKWPEKLQDNIPYTIEPGLYFSHLKSPFGVRSELDFYIADKEIHLTTPLQKEIEILL